MKKSNVFIVGAQKCGTTSLANYFDLHPEIELIATKEPHIFSNKFKSHADATKAIEALYKTRDKKIYVDASTTYSFGANSKKVANRIHTYNPQAKILYIVKDPIERITSHYNHRIRKNRVSEPIDIDVRQIEGYLENSMYYHCITPYLEIFGEENVMILSFENLKNNIQKVAGEIAVFLNLTKPFQGELPNTNRNLEGSLVITQYGTFRDKYMWFLPERIQIYIRDKYFRKSITEKAVPSEETIVFLKDKLAEDMQKFYELTGIDYR